MANEEHLKILKKGVKAWNAWRKEHPGERPDLKGANLSGGAALKTDLSSADFSGAYLHGAVFSGAILRNADFSGAQLRGVDLSHADLSHADLGHANLSDANLGHAKLSHANLGRAHLSGADLIGADLSSADLSSADLSSARLSWANLYGADLSGARFSYTFLDFSRLWEATGLETVHHDGPSGLGVDVLQRAKGQLPAVFLQGCGLSDWEIEVAKLHNPTLSEGDRKAVTYEILRIQGQQPIQLNHLFISYSQADALFVEALEPRFDKLGIRYWRDVHDLKAGRLETQIDRAIRLNPTVLLVLSKKSVESDWVEWEVRTARKLEQKHGRDVLCPVALDDKWKSCRWPKRLRAQIEEYNILDFSEWKDDKGIFERQLGKLFEGLKLYYRPKT